MSLFLDNYLNRNPHFSRMGFWDWLKKDAPDRWSSLDNALSQSFGRIKSETSLIFSWLHYLREKDRINDDRAHYAQQQIDAQKEQISNLKSEMMALRHEFLTLKTSQGQVGTPQGTSKGQVKDMSPAPKAIAHQESVTFDKTQLRGAELELLQLLYHSDRPLSYEEIAKRLGKSEKSIRNLIYEIRHKNVEIKARPVGIREKGFYLTEQTKIAISGR